MDFETKIENISENNLNLSTAMQTSNKRPRRNLPTISSQNVLNKMEFTTKNFCNDDTNFEPTIDMMVNDFDDEQTMNEEEKLAELDVRNSSDEISILIEEGEMPLQELISRYQCPVLQYEKKYPKFLKDIKCKELLGKHDEKSVENLVIKNSLHTTSEENDMFNSSLNKIESAVVNIECNDKKDAFSGHSHLLDLYADLDFISCNENDGLKEIYDENISTYDEENHVGKKISIGKDYQAIIPVSLSHYGDILPYENEDKLLWDPSQVNEIEVEDYLCKVRNVKHNWRNGETRKSVLHDMKFLKGCNTLTYKNHSNQAKDIDSFGGNDPPAYKQFEFLGAVKDNEQALHLLVQCGYDFKEALRRRQLNIMSNSVSMSLWSEEECVKFEEGIQKYGKDFFKIRKYLVRTRSMRELVQFYYFWKKSARRDHEFANSDTVDHMEAYLNESNDYCVRTVTGLGSSTNLLPSINEKQKISFVPEKFSIFTGGNHISTTQISNLTLNKKKVD